LNILAIDSSTEVCSVAFGNGADIFEEKNASRSGHSQTILELISTVLDNAQATLEELDLLAVDVGPGSFTGLRIGIGVAKGIAYAGRLPVAGISSLEEPGCSASDQGAG
jgi:tRNA threonylcarbamoyladenosine biosynthesis protein TsaB